MTSSHDPGCPVLQDAGEAWKPECTCKPRNFDITCLPHDAGSVHGRCGGCGFTDRQLAQIDAIVKKQVKPDDTPEMILAMTRATIRHMALINAMHDRIDRAISELLPAGICPEDGQALSIALERAHRQAISLAHGVELTSVDYQEMLKTRRSTAAMLKLFGL